MQEIFIPSDDDAISVLAARVRASGLGLKYFSALLGKHESTLSRMLRGIVPCSVQDYQKINLAIPAPLSIIHNNKTHGPLYRAEPEVRGSVSAKGTPLNIARRRFKVWVLRFELEEPWAIPRIARELGFSLGSINGDIRALKNGYDPVAVLVRYWIDPDAVRAELGELYSSNAKTSLFEYNDLPLAVAQ